MKKFDAKKEVEEKLTTYNFEDYDPEEFNEILYAAHLITEKTYKNRIREIKLNKLNNEKKDNKGVGC